MTRRGWLLAAVAMAVVAIALLGMSVRVGERGRFAAAYSSFGSGPKGGRGVFLLTEAAGVETVRWVSDLQWLPPSGTLVALGGCDHPASRALSRYEREALVTWVRDGGTVIVAGATDYLPDAFGVSLAEPRGGCEATSWLGRVAEEDDGASMLGETVEALSGEHRRPSVWAMPSSSGILAGLDPVELVEPGVVSVEDDAAAEVWMRLAEEGKEEPAAVASTFGEGRVIVLASASPFQNARLLEDDGAALFRRILTSTVGPVYFDEYHLGVGARRSMIQYLRGAGGTAVLLQVVFLVVFLLWRAGARLGPATPRLEYRSPSVGALVSAVGGLYARSGDAEGALRRVARHALERVADRYHLRVTGAAQLAQALEERGRKDQAAAVRELGVLVAAPLVPRKSDLVTRAATVDALTERALRLE